MAASYELKASARERTWARGPLGHCVAKAFSPP